MINLLFLLNIIRVLVMKLRQSRSSEIEQVRKAVRAAIFLLPLMGIAHILFLLDYRFKDAWKFKFWSYTTYFLNTFQGFFVAVLYCFLNGEVQTAIKNSYVHLSLRKYDYSRCRQFTLISTVGTDSDTNNSTAYQNWIKCWKASPQSPEEKEIDLCDIGDRKDGPTTVTVVETDPMLNTRIERNNTTKKSVGNTESATHIAETNSHEQE